MVVESLSVYIVDAADVDYDVELVEHVLVSTSHDLSVLVGLGEVSEQAAAHSVVGVEDARVGADGLVGLHLREDIVQSEGGNQFTQHVN